LIGTATALAGDVQPRMVQRDAFLLDESVAGGLHNNRWTVANGEWRVENGTLAGTERPADHHAAVIKMPFTNPDYSSTRGIGFQPVIQENRQGAYPKLPVRE
jgi:hypothetical protein